MAKTPSYQVRVFDLPTPRTQAPLLLAGVQYDGVAVLVLAPGAVASVALGTNKDNIPLREGLDIQMLDACGNPFPADEGLFLTNPAGAGSLTLLISLSQGSVTV